MEVDFNSIIKNYLKEHLSVVVDASHQTVEVNLYIDDECISKDYSYITND